MNPYTNFIGQDLSSSMLIKKIFCMYFMHFVKPPSYNPQQNKFKKVKRLNKIFS